MDYTYVPQRFVGPLSLCFDKSSRQLIQVPLATYESTLWPSVSRGAKLSRLSSKGIVTCVTSDMMTRSVIFEANSLIEAISFQRALSTYEQDFPSIVATTSSYCQYQSCICEVVGTMIYLRLSFSTGLASGHNMTTLAAEAIQQHLLKTSSVPLNYLSISGNMCVDKKNSAINGLLGRGKAVHAELTLTADMVERHLRTTPEALEKLNWHKNYLGSALSGSIRSANAHFANMLLAIYLATGQDAANIVEGSQGFTYAKVNQDRSLSFSISLPNLIVGSIGHGKHSPSALKNLEALGCTGQSHLGDEHSALRLAQIIAGTVLCGEISLLAAQNNPGELMKSHRHYERFCEKSPKHINS